MIRPCPKCQGVDWQMIKCFISPHWNIGSSVKQVPVLLASETLMVAVWCNSRGILFRDRCEFKCSVCDFEWEHWAYWEFASFAPNGTLLKC